MCEPYQIIHINYHAWESAAKFTVDVLIQLTLPTDAQPLRIKDINDFLRFI